MKIEQIFFIDTSTRYDLPYYLSQAKAGFPSPADDYIERKLDLNRYLIRHPAATYFVKVSGDSMINAGIHDGDLLIVDRSLTPTHKDIIMAVVNGELTVKRYHVLKDNIRLVPENPDYFPIEVHEGMEFEVWGVVVHAVHHLKSNA